MAADPNVDAVVALFDTYFGAVNAHDPVRAASVFAPGGEIDPSDPGEVARFGNDIATSVDTEIVVRSIGATAAGLDVQVDFTSSQAGDKGPVAGETCTRWAIVYHLVPHGAGLGLLNGTAAHQAC